jgi:hypothetical protein
VSFSDTWPLPSSSALPTTCISRVWLGVALTVNTKLRLDSWLLASVAVTVMLKVPTCVAVPDSKPAVLRLRPVGSVPPVSAKL